MSDPIERQDAIDTLDKHLQTTDVPVSYPGIISALTEWLNELSPAKPEIVRCKDCKYAIDYYSDGECYCRRPNRLLDWIGDWNFYCGAAERRKNEETELSERVFRF